MYYSYDEVFGQGDALRRTYDAILQRSEDFRSFLAGCDYEEIVCVACGSSYWASLSAHMTMQEQLGVRCSAVKSGDIVLNIAYYEKAYHKPLVIAPSRSGSTTETVRAIEMFKRVYNAKVVSIVEYPASEIQKQSDWCVELPWANETSVCQTRSFSNMYLSMVVLACVASGEDTVLADIGRYLQDFNTHSAAAEKEIRRILGEFTDWRSLVALGHGKQYGVVVEGAYINVEMAQTPAHYFGTLEWRHGPIVLADGSYLVAITCGAPAIRAHEEKMAAETRHKGARVLAISDVGGFSEADYQLCLGREACLETVALFSVMVLQGFAHLSAVKQGIDPDNPVELVSWISI